MNGIQDSVQCKQTSNSAAQLQPKLNCITNLVHTRSEYTIVYIIRLDCNPVTGEQLLPSAWKNQFLSETMDLRQQQMNIKRNEVWKWQGKHNF
jgi:hypothetical protein